MLKRPELLAPAGGWEALVAAVENGADAVYLGGRAFNARHSAANFDDEELKRAVEFAHVRGVKVYVTANILIADQELPEAARFLHFLQNCGVDAVIVQDLGLARLARKVIPELPLHASTQMTVHSRAAVLELQEMGFERIVLAREMQLKDIANIKEETGADLEVFIHGALCVCYSGQCLLSSMIGGRSGNRGRCAQPCRLQYTLVDQKGRPMVDPERVGEYLLSPRDLNMSEYVPDLIKAGIDSFKIEGRMKRPEYVATVIRVYRDLIDRALSGADFAITPEQSRELAQVFNRDFTTGYFYGRQGRDLMSYKRPNNRGVRLGRVKRYNKDTRLVEIALEEPLRLGDGLEVWVTEGGRVGTEIHEIISQGRQVERAPSGAVVGISIQGRVRPGDRVFKTYDADLMERAKISFTSPREQRKEPLNFAVRARFGEPLSVKVFDRDGRTGQAETAMSCERALKKPLAYEYLRSQLDRLGNTPYSMASFECDIEDGIIVPVREINEARRRALDMLSRQRAGEAGSKPVAKDVFKGRLAFALGAEEKTEQFYNRKPKRERPSLAVSVNDLASLHAAVWAGADVVYFGGESFRSKGFVKVEDVRSGASFCREHGVKMIYSTPRVIHDHEQESLLRILEKIEGYGLEGILVGGLGLLRTIRRHTCLPLYSDYGFNVFNAQTVTYLLEHGVILATLSTELTMEQVKALSGHNFEVEVMVHGALELMISEYCAVGSLMGGLSSDKSCAGPCSGQKCGLKDRMGAVFPIEVDQFCRMHIFNSRDLCLIEDVVSLAEAGVSSMRIEARRESSDYITAAVKAYRRAIDMGPGGEKQWQELLLAKESLTKYSPAGFTKGHYFRGVL